MNAVILFAHGSRDPDWAAPFHTLKRKIAAAQPGTRVELAFLELMQPSLAEAVADVSRACDRIVIAPLFMGRGAHLRRDVTRLVQELREKHPAVTFELLRGIGEIDSVIDAMALWISEAAKRSVTS